MKPEPLKDKQHKVVKLIKDDILTENVINGFYKKDIKSAVEWLKENVQYLPLTEVKQLHLFEKAINEAFEDVIEK